MPFKKNNKLGFRSTEENPLDRTPLSIKLHQGVRDRLMKIPKWQSELRAVIEEWVASKAEGE